uniref:Uncharacterized protein n=1 Tax=Meloidogyne javanica TaxID=6303 RepID=A0A915N186_MELJA
MSNFNPNQNRGNNNMAIKHQNNYAINSRKYNQQRNSSKQQNRLNGTLKDFTTNKVSNEGSGEECENLFFLRIMALCILMIKALDSFFNSIFDDFLLHFNSIKFLSRYLE